MPEVKIIYALYLWLGLPATFLGIWTNWGNWKADVLFFLSAILLVLRIVVYIIEKNQLRQERELELEKKRYEWKKYLKGE